VTATCCAPGRTGQVLGHEVVAPPTLGTILRAFTFGLSGSWAMSSVRRLRQRRGAAHPVADGVGEHVARDVARHRRVDRPRRPRRRDRPEAAARRLRLWANKTFDRLDRRGLAVLDRLRLQTHVRAAIDQIYETSWTTLEDYV
jgi:hypothetical protein